MVVVFGLAYFPDLLFPNEIGIMIGQVIALVGCLGVSLISKYKFRFGGALMENDTMDTVYLDGKETLMAVLKPGLGVLLAVILLLVHPGQEIFYYGTALLILVLMGWNAMELIEQFNRLATRPIPQFRKRGGEIYGK